MESRGRFCGPQNVSGASQENTTEADGDLFQNARKTKQKNSIKVGSRTSSGVIEVARSSEIPTSFQKRLFAPLQKLKSSGSC